MLLEEALSHYDSFQKFYTYSQKAFKAETLEFLMLTRWLNPELGKSAINLFPTNCDSVSEKIQYIYKTYVAKTSKKFIGLGSELEKQLESDVKTEIKTMEKHTFDKAYKAAFSLVVSDTWLKFCQDKASKAADAQIDPVQPYVPPALAVPPPIVFNAPAPPPAPAAPPPAPAAPAAPVAPAAANVNARDAMAAALALAPAIAAVTAVVPGAGFSFAAATAILPAALAARTAAARPAAVVNAPAAVAPAPHVPAAPPLPPVFVIPPESIPTRPRANAHPVMLVRQRGVKDLKIYQQP